MQKGYFDKYAILHGILLEFQRYLEYNGLVEYNSPLGVLYMPATDWEYLTFPNQVLGDKEVVFDLVDVYTDPWGRYMVNYTTSNNDDDTMLLDDWLSLPSIGENPCLDL